MTKIELSAMNNPASKPPTQRAAWFDEAVHGYADRQRTSRGVAADQRHIVTLSLIHI